MPTDFSRYLEAKRTVDDRALNRAVLQTFQRELGAGAAAPRILEIGAGVGAMLERLVDWNVLTRADYTLVDADSELLAHVFPRIKAWAARRGARARETNGVLRVSGNDDLDITVRVAAAELGAFLETERAARYDALIACALLDLVDVPNVLPKLWAALEPEAPFWFAINFDGETIFMPEHPSDSGVLRLYHRSMDTRTFRGAPAGDSKTGRRLFTHLPTSGARILASGSSDWIVFPRVGGYPAEEGLFLHHILDTIETALRGHEDLASEQLTTWLAQRRAQADRAELVYIAHQLDFAGRANLERTRAREQRA